MKVDQAGEQVLRFMSEAKNLTRVGELTDEIAVIAKSDHWRRYTTAMGEDQWRESEFDYFLIACGLAWEDVSRVVAWSKTGAELAPLMDHREEDSKRRTLEEAARTWHAPGPETLTERAVRLGWTKGDGSLLRAAPLTLRARVRQVHGVTRDEYTKRGRAERVSKTRRRELDVLARTIWKQLEGDLERLYLIDRLREFGPGRGRPQGDVEQWRADMKDGSSTRQLAEKWKISERAARQRVRQVRDQESG